MPPWRILLASLSVVLITTAGCMALLSAQDAPNQPPFSPSQGQAAADAYGDEPAPRAIVGIPDSGINPYHEAFHRPGLTQHPCTYLEGFPCDVEKLPLSVGEHDDHEAGLEADEHLWESVEEGTVYWIPETNIVAAACHEHERDDRDWGACILDADGHGTAAASSVVTENPRALLAIEHGGPQLSTLDDAGIPVDVRSISWQSHEPTLDPEKGAPLYVIAAGNEPWSTLMDGWSGHPSHIAVGGGYADGWTQEAEAAKQPDVVSHYCRPVAHHEDTSAWREACGTSFSAPTVAGALSKAILEVREETGYTGGLQGNTVDPIAGVTVQDVRDAMNRTATYEPEPRFGNQGQGIPLQEEAPWLNWGWGFYDGRSVDETVEHLLRPDEGTSKPDPARSYMQAQQTVRETLYR